MKTIADINLDVSPYDKIDKHRMTGRNFMTPDIMAFYFIPHKNRKAEMLVELSEGSGFNGDKIYGITCSNNRESYHELSTCCHSMSEAVDYINNLT